MARPTPTSPVSSPGGPTDGTADRAGRDDAGLAATLEAELTRVATRLDPAPDPGATSLLPAVAAPTAVVSPDAASAATGAPARADDPLPTRGPRLGWAAVLTLLNVVLSGFILMLWGLPRWASSASSAPLAPPTMSAPSAPGGAALGATPPAAAGVAPSEPASPAGARSATDVSLTPASGAAPRSGPRDTAVPTAASAAPSSPSSTSSAIASGIAPSRIPRDASPSRPSAGPQPPTPSATVPSLPSAPLANIPGQRVADAPAPLDADSSSAIVNAGEGGVTMPERIPESHVRPTIVALPTGEPVTGEVRLRATVRVDGSVQDVEVVSSTRPGVGLEDSAIDAVRRWRYKPATRDGQPVDARLAITLTFR